MPWMLEGDCVHKKNEDGSKGELVKCHDSQEKAKAHMRALYANVEDSGLAELSFTVTKASYNKSEKDPNRKRTILMVSSDTSPDLYDERMSQELFKDFCDRITKNDSVPDVFRSAVCEDGVWCGGMPYISIAHFRAGRDGKNIPGTVESVYVDGSRLKSKAFLHDTPLGRSLFDSLCDDIEKFKSGVTDHKPVRVSIGFLDLEHKHEVQGKSVVFTRTALGQKCDLCEDGVGGKIYTKGYLVHLAATRVPVNQRTEMALEEKSMDEITTKHDDAASIVGEDLAKELEQKSIVDDVLVVKADSDNNTSEPSKEDEVASLRDEIATVKSEVLDEVRKLSELLQAKSPVVEESMDEKEKDPKEEKKEEEVKEEKSEVTPLDAKFAELKSLLVAGKTMAEVQEAFNAVGDEVKKSYVAPAASVDDIATIVRSAVEAAETRINQKIAVLEAQTVAKKSTVEHPVSRALSLKVEDLVKRAVPPTQEQSAYSSIQEIARRSVYGQ